MPGLFGDLLFEVLFEAEKALFLEPAGDSAIDVGIGLLVGNLEIQSFLYFLRKHKLNPFVSCCSIIGRANSQNK